MIIHYKNTFYKFIDTFINIKLPENIFKDTSSKNFDENIISQYKNIKREDLDYLKASMILLDGKHFTDEAFLYYFPMLIKHILDQNGHIEAVINRLNTIELDNFIYEEQKVILDMIKNLKEIQRRSDENAEDIILIV